MLVTCQCCHRTMSDKGHWFVCDSCGYRICPSCLSSHSGPFSSGGYKCSQCAWGHMKKGRWSLNDCTVRRHIKEGLVFPIR